MALDSGLHIVQQACPLFVPLVEEGLIYGSVTREAVRYYLDGLVADGIDTLILGCTHYPLLKNTIKTDSNLFDTMK